MVRRGIHRGVRLAFTRQPNIIYQVTQTTPDGAYIRPISGGNEIFKTWDDLIPTQQVA